jgi:hypothetical protein
MWESQLLREKSRGGCTNSSNESDNSDTQNLKYQRLKLCIMFEKFDTLFLKHIICTSSGSGQTSTENFARPLLLGESVTIQEMTTNNGTEQRFYIEQRFYSILSNGSILLHALMRCSASQNRAEATDRVAARSTIKLALVGGESNLSVISHQTTHAYHRQGDYDF